jgi:hypothetical protein
MPQTIVWSAVFTDVEEPCVTRRTTEIHSVIPLPPEDSAAQAFKWWLGEDRQGGFETNWESYLGNECDEVLAAVIIHEPADMAGVYEVRVERVTTARGYIADDTVRDTAMRVISESEAVTP